MLKTHEFYDSLYCNNCGKRKSYEYDAFVFHAIYNSGHKITFLVDTDFAKNLEKAEKYALIYSKSMGQRF